MATSTWTLYGGSGIGPLWPTAYLYRALYCVFSILIAIWVTHHFNWFVIMLIYANEGDVMQISMQIRSTINMATSTWTLYLLSLGQLDVNFESQWYRIGGWAIMKSPEIANESETVSLCLWAASGQWIFFFQDWSGFPSGFICPGPSCLISNGTLLPAVCKSQLASCEQSKITQYFDKLPVNSPNFVENLRPWSSFPPDGDRTVSLFQSRRKQKSIPAQNIRWPRDRLYFPRFVKLAPCQWGSYPDSHSHKLIVNIRDLTFITGRGGTGSGEEGRSREWCGRPRKDRSPIRYKSLLKF